eukprot:4172915-Prymnesium_polylepis.1
MLTRHSMFVRCVLNEVGHSEMTRGCSVPHTDHGMEDGDPSDTLALSPNHDPGAPPSLPARNPELNVIPVARAFRARPRRHFPPLVGRA